MSALQVESSMAARRGVLFRKLSAALPLMPERFMATELYKAAGVNWTSPQQRMLLASVLETSLNCHRVKVGGQWRWKRPVLLEAT